MRAFVEGDVDADAVRLHYYRTSGGRKLPPVVLCHGFTDNGLCWRRTALQLADDFDVVMVDARNHGRSGTAGGGVRELVADLAAVIAGLGLGSPTVIGHSIGAAVAAHLAADHPELVTRLVLEDPPWRAADDAADRTRDRDEVREYLLSFADMTDEQIDSLGRLHHPDWDEVDRPDWVDAKRQLRVEAADQLQPAPWPDIVDRIECSTLLLHAQPGRDGIVTPEVARRAFDHNPRIVVRAVAGAGHNIRRENFTDFMASVREFLRS